MSATLAEVVALLFSGFLLGITFSYVSMLIWVKVNTDELEPPWPHDATERKVRER